MSQFSKKGRTKLSGWSNGFIFCVRKSDYVITDDVITNFVVRKNGQIGAFSSEKGLSSGWLKCVLIIHKCLLGVLRVVPYWHLVPIKFQRWITMKNREKMPFFGTFPPRNFSTRYPNDPKPLPIHPEIICAYFKSIKTRLEFILFSLGDAPFRPFFEKSSFS